MRRNLLTVIELAGLTAALLAALCILNDAAHSGNSAAWVPAATVAAITALALTALATVMMAGSTLRVAWPHLAHMLRARAAAREPQPFIRRLPRRKRRQRHRVI